MKNKQLIKFYSNRKIVITGHTGFVGSWLSYILSSYGAKVYGISLKPKTNLNNFNILEINKNIEKSYILNILNTKSLIKIFKKINPDLVFHLAAQPYVIESYKNPRETVETNYNGTFNILECINKLNIKHNVIITTDKVYENLEKKNFFKEDDKLGGKDIYSASKAASEILCESYFQSFLKSKKIYLDTARAGNIIGGGDFGKDRIIPDIIKSIKKKIKFFVRSPNSIRPWQHIYDVCYGYILIPLNQNKRSILKKSWNFGPNKNQSDYKVKEIVNLFSKSFNKKFKYSIKKVKFKESKYLMLNNSNSKKFLKWRPIYNFNDGIKETIKWYDIFLNQKSNIKKFSQISLDSYKKKL